MKAATHAPVAKAEASLHAPPLDSVVLVDDHELTRRALTQIIHQETPLCVVASLDSSGLTSSALLACAPTLVVFDIAQLLEAATLTQLEAVFSNYAGALLTYASFAYDRHIEEALHLGSRGFVLKTSPLLTLLDGLRQVAAGETYFDPLISARLISVAAGPDYSSSRQLFATRRSLLSKREWEVLALVAEGYKAREIARNLHISAKTVERHKANLMAKLGIPSQLGLARYALAEIFLNV